MASFFCACVRACVCVAAVNANVLYITWACCVILKKGFKKTAQIRSRSSSRSSYTTTTIICNQSAFLPRSSHFFIFLLLLSSSFQIRFLFFYLLPFFLRLLSCCVSAICLQMAKLAPYLINVVLFCHPNVKSARPHSIFTISFLISSPLLTGKQQEEEFFGLKKTLMSLMSKDVHLK